MKEGIRLRDFDWTMLLIVLAICSLGIVEIYSATHAASPGSKLVGMHWRQFWWVMIGVVAAIVAVHEDVGLDERPVGILPGGVLQRRLRAALGRVHRARPERQRL